VPILVALVTTRPVMYRSHPKTKTRGYRRLCECRPQTEWLGRLADSPEKKGNLWKQHARKAARTIFAWRAATTRRPKVSTWQATC